jgi:RHS repeat-associated protein
VSAASGKQLHLQISQIAPGGGSIAGGSGLISFGTYLIQVVDGSGVLVKHGLRKPVTLKLRPTTKKESALDLRSAFAVVNSTLPEGTAVAPTSFTPATPQHGPLMGPSQPEAIYPSITDRAALGMGALSSVRPTLDTATNSLVTPLTLGNPSTSVTWNTNSSVATFGAPDPFTVSLSSGALIGSLPIALPPAPSGTLPPVQLNYNSAEVSERHNVAAPAPWVGEGWSMGLGAISWTQLNLHGYCSPGCGDLWQSQWFMNDAFGTGSELVPNDWSMSTYYDDTPYVYCVVSGGACTYPNWPKTAWRTADGVYNKVVSYVGPNALGGQQAVPPCFRAWRTDGTMLEFGCTTDSLVYYVPSNTGFRITSWLLDLITDPEGNQIHLTYQQDITQGFGNTPYPRATELATIEYDDPTCHDAQARCAGANWNPLVKVVFNASHAPARLTNSPSGCNTGLNLRCDDPLDLSGSGGLKTAAVESTFVLNDIQVQTRNGTANPWNTLRDYQFSYAQSGPTTITDPATGLQQSTAGQLVLTKYKELGDDGTMALPERNFSYTSVTQYFTDSGYHPNPTTNCGPAWNTGTGSGCLLWSQSSAGNSSYLVGADNGMGLHSIFSWDNARDNTHGVNGGGDTNNSNPLYCNTLTAAQQATYPCNAADDHGWSRAVTSIRRQQHYRAASSGNVLIDSVYTYTYALTTGLPALLCTDCTVGMYWGNKNDSDYPDFYNGHFMGFVGVSEYFPDGSKIGHRYYATEGWGVYDTSQVSCTAPCANDSWWHLTNAAHGMEFEATYYDTDNATVLKQDKTQYSVACPPPNVAATPPYTNPAWGNWNGNRVSGLDHNNPVAVCSVLPSQVDHFQFDGGGAWKVPQSTTTYAYEGNNYRRLTDVTTSNAPGLKGDYFGNIDLTNLKVTRLDPTIDFNWGTGSPDPSIQNTRYSARYTGKVTPKTSETYTFYTTSDDGVRLWVNGTQIINNWTDHGPTENSGTIALTAGTPYDIKLEYYQDLGGAEIHLSWSSPSVAKQIVPQSAFSLSSNATGSPDQIVAHTDYIWNDNITASLNNATGTYLIDFPANAYTRDLANTTHYSCHQASYDTAAYATGQQSSLSKGEATTSDTYTGCGTSPSFTPTGQLRSTTVYDVYGQVVAGKDPDANAGVSGHVGCTVNSVQYTSCATYDSVYKTLPVSSANALNQSGSIAYTNSAGGGFGFWPTSATDANGQIDSFGYDPLGRQTSSTLPSEGTGLTTTSTTYTAWCAATGAQAPCVEVDETQRLDSNNTVTQRSFYDGLGRLVETRTPAPNGQDVVHYSFYDSSGHPYFNSNAYFVSAYTGAPGAAAFSTPDVNQVGSSSTYDALDREKQVTDPLSNVTTKSYAAVCNVVNGDFVCYEETKTIDANSHQDTSYDDSWGRATYAKSYTGNSSGSYAVYATTTDKYDGNGNLVQITHPNGTSLTSWTYDAARRQTALSDPDRGSESYAFDQNGNVSQITDARGSGGTIYAGYDGLNRQTWRNTTNSSTGAYVAYTYDSTAGGNQGIGRRTSETFSGSLGSGSYSYTYDGRGQVTNTSTTLGGTTYPLNATYNDAGQVLTQTYPTNETVTNAYGSQGWLASLTRTQSGSGTQTLLGDTTVEPNQDFEAAGTMVAFKYTATASGSADQVTFYLDGANAATQVLVGLYNADGSGNPNTLLGQATLSAPAADAWNTVSLSSVTLTAGQTYFIALLSPAGNGSLYYRDTAGGSGDDAPTSQATNLGALPSAFGAVDHWPQRGSGYVTHTGTGGGTTTLADTLAYTGPGGAAGALTSARLGNNTYNETFSYDNGLRLTGATVTRVSDSATLFASTPSYDAINNVVSVATTLPSGTDNQGFCYDEQDRLTWAGTSGSMPCGGTVTAGTLTSAAYSQSFGYDNMNRLTSGSAGTYTYGDGAHLHAATAVSTGYTAKYDAAGDMTCRAPTSGQTCSGTLTGAALTYDNEGRLTQWQNAQSSPTSTDSFLYDGEGNRVEQQSAVSGTTTTTVYVGGMEELKTTAGSTTTTTYYTLGRQRIALAVNGTLSYLASDLLGSTTVALDGAGNVSASQLFAPYGTSRYVSGTMPTDRGFTGQHGDAVTGLDYYNARYFDPVVGQFTSADTALDGLNRYAYVKGNPETDTDPTGHDVVEWLQAVQQWIEESPFNVMAFIRSIVLTVTMGSSIFLGSGGPPADTGGPTSDIHSPGTQAPSGLDPSGAGQAGPEEERQDNGKGGKGGKGRKGEPDDRGGHRGRPTNDTRKPRVTGNPGLIRGRQGGYHFAPTYNPTFERPPVTYRAPAFRHDWVRQLYYETHEVSSVAATASIWDALAYNASQFGSQAQDAVSHFHVAIGPLAFTGVVGILLLVPAAVILA